MALSTAAATVAPSMRRTPRDRAPAAVVNARARAARRGIPVTGASDYHGAGKPNRLGENLTAPAVYEELIAQGRLEVVRP